MPYQKIDGTDVEYGLISFDNNGVERTDDPTGGVFSKTLVERARTEKPTNIFLFSHGWKGDVPSAIDQYNRWIGAMARLTADRAAMGSAFKPMFIGLHWPSQPWGTESSSGGNSFGAGGAGNAPADLDALKEETVRHFGDRPGVREALDVIFNAQKQDPGVFMLPDEVVAAYLKLGDAIGFNAGSGNAPDQEGSALDPQQASRADRLASTSVAFGSGGGGGFLGGVLGGLRQLSFWVMKKRARTAGEQGMHQFVAALENACDAQIHLMGHSFGCIVTASILGGPGGNTKLPRPVQSVALVQGAFSLWSFADRIKDTNDPGYFRQVLTNGSVAGPIITTQSIHDSAVGTYYPAAVFLVGQAAFGVDLPLFGAVGSYGIQGTQGAQTLAMQDANFAYKFKPGVVYNLESSKFIKKMDGASGAHSDIDGPEVAHAIWQAALPMSAGQGS